MNLINRAAASLNPHLMRTSVQEDSAVHKAKQLLDAAYARGNDIGTDDSKVRNLVNIFESVPTGKSEDDAERIASFSGNARAFNDGKEVATNITINPNAPASTFAHELGHHVSNLTGPGHQIRKVRDYLTSNGNLAKALAVSAGLTPLVGASLQEGDDDLIESLAIASLVASPTLVDEALATKNALQIMDKAGVKPTMGDKTRFAKDYLSYAITPILMGALGHAGGNVLDDYISIYDL